MICMCLDIYIIKYSNVYKTKEPWIHGSFLFHAWNEKDVARIAQKLFSFETSGKNIGLTTNVQPSKGP